MDGADLLVGPPGTSGRASTSAVSPSVVTASRRSPPGGARGGATSDARHRRMAALQLRASEAVRQRVQTDGLLRQEEAFLQHTEAERSARLQEHREVLEQQICAKETRRAAETASLASESGPEAWPSSQPPGVVDIAVRRNRDMLTSEAKASIAARLAAGEAPPMPPEAQQCESPRDSAMTSEYRGSLEKQIEAKRLRGQALRVHERSLAQQMAATEALEVSQRRAQELALKARQKQVLTSSWQEDVKIKDLQKSIEALEQGRRLPGSVAGPGAILQVATGPAPMSARGRAGRQDVQHWMEHRSSLSARGQAIDAAASLTLSP